MRRQCPRPQPALLAASEGNWLQKWSSRTMHIEGARPLGSVELVAGEREDIDRQCADIEGDLAHRLSGIRVENDASLAANSADRGDILHHSDLIIREHDGNQGRVR